MISFDDVIGENMTKENSVQVGFEFHIIIGATGSGKANELLNLTNNQSDVDSKISMKQISVVNF